MSTADDYLKLPIDEMIRKLQTERLERARALTQTRCVYALWRDCLTYRAPKVLVDETNALLRATCKAEWGSETEVIFDFDAKTVTIENFDGRIEILRGDK